MHVLALLAIRPRMLVKRPIGVMLIGTNVATYCAESPKVEEECLELVLSGGVAQEHHQTAIAPPPSAPPTAVTV